jgi:hypothetical protein
VSLSSGLKENCNEEYRALYLPGIPRHPWRWGRWYVERHDILSRCRGKHIYLIVLLWAPAWIITGCLFQDIYWPMYGLFYWSLLILTLLLFILSLLPNFIALCSLTQVCFQLILYCLQCGPLTALVEGNSIFRNVMCSKLRGVLVGHVASIFRIEE